MRNTAAVLLPGIAVVMLSGCTASLSCTEIGYFNEITVEPTGDRSAEMSSLELCSELGCVTRTTARGDGAWTFVLSVDTPETVRVVATDAAGESLADAQFSVEWTPTDEPNGAGCDNRSVTEPLTFDLG